MSQAKLIPREYRTLLTLDTNNTITEVLPSINMPFVPFLQNSDRIPYNPSPSSHGIITKQRKKEDARKIQKSSKYITATSRLLQVCGNYRKENTSSSTQPIAST